MEQVWLSDCSSSCSKDIFTATIWLDCTNLSTALFVCAFSCVCLFFACDCWWIYKVTWTAQTVRIWKLRLLTFSLCRSSNESKAFDRALEDYRESCYGNIFVRKMKINSMERFWKSKGKRYRQKFFHWKRWLITNGAHNPWFSNAQIVAWNAIED